MRIDPVNAGEISGCTSKQKAVKIAFFDYESPALTAELWALKIVNQTLCHERALFSLIFRYRHQV